jgi:hypothetical protein
MTALVEDLAATYRALLIGCVEDDIAALERATDDWEQAVLEAVYTGIDGLPFDDPLFVVELKRQTARALPPRRRRRRARRGRPVGRVW